MRKAFEPLPILVAATIGLVVFLIVRQLKYSQSLSAGEAAGIGATVGAVVQIGVRLFGVS